MQPDTTLHPYTVIDYAAYRRAARVARASALADRPTRRLALRLTSVWALVIAIVTAAAGLQAGVGSCRDCAPERAASALLVPFW